MRLRAALPVVLLALGGCVTGAERREPWTLPDIVESPLPLAADPSEKMVRVEVETWIVEEQVRRELGVRIAGAYAAGGEGDFAHYSGGPRFLASVHAALEESRTRTRSSTFITTLVDTEGRVTVGAILPLIALVRRRGIVVTLEHVQRGFAVVPSYVSDDVLSIALSYVFEEAPRGGAHGRSLEIDSNVLVPDGGAVVVARGETSEERSFAHTFLSAGEEHADREFVLVLRTRYLN